MKLVLRLVVAVTAATVVLTAGPPAAVAGPGCATGLICAVDDAGTTFQFWSNDPDLGADGTAAPNFVSVSHLSSANNAAFFYNRPNYSGGLAFCVSSGSTVQLPPTRAGSLRLVPGVHPCY